MIAHMREAAVWADARLVSEAAYLPYDEQNSYKRAILSVRVEVLQ